MDVRCVIDDILKRKCSWKIEFSKDTLCLISVISTNHKTVKKNYDSPQNLLRWEADHRQHGREMNLHTFYDPYTNITKAEFELVK